MPLPDDAGVDGAAVPLRRPRFLRFTFDAAWNEGHMPDTHALIDGMQSAYATWGYPIVFLGAMLENTILLGFLLPGGTLVVLGAAYAQNGSMELPLVAVLAWAGTVLGASLDFALGRFGLRSRLAGRARRSIDLVTSVAG